MNESVLKVDENGDGSVDIVNVELRRALTLTAADLRFIDFVVKEVEANAKSPSVHSFLVSKAEICFFEINIGTECKGLCDIVSSVLIFSSLIECLFSYDRIATEIFFLYKTGCWMMDVIFF